MGSVAEDPQFPVEPAACAGCSPCSGAPCYIQLYVPFPHRPHPDTWRSGSSEETPLERSKKRKKNIVYKAVVCVITIIIYSPAEIIII